MKCDDAKLQISKLQVLQIVKAAKTEPGSFGHAAVDLINRIQQIATALKQAGMVKATPPQGDASKAG
jgi:hypothetical protein